MSECAVRGRVRSAAARDDSEAQPDAQDCKLRELIERVWNGTADLVSVQSQDVQLRHLADVDRNGAFDPQAGQQSARYITHVQRRVGDGEEPRAV